MRKTFKYREGELQELILLKNLNERSVLDKLVEKFTYKAESAGIKTILFNPKNISKRYSNCGNAYKELTLKDILYQCSKKYKKLGTSFATT